MGQFLLAIFTDRFINVTGLALTVIFGVAAMYFEAGQDNAIRALTLIILALLFLAAVLGIRAFQFYMTYARRMKVLRQVAGDGPRSGKSFLSVENPGFLRDNVLLTLYSPTSGADQSVCVLKIDKALPGQAILARPFPDTAVDTDLSNYFDADSTSRLYVNTMIHVSDLTAMFQGLQLGQTLALPNELTEAQDG